MSKDRKDHLIGRLVLRIIGNSLAALLAGYFYETGRKVSDKASPSQIWQGLKGLTSDLVGQATGNLLAGSDADPADEVTGTGRFTGVEDL